MNYDDDDARGRPVRLEASPSRWRVNDIVSFCLLVFGLVGALASLFYGETAGLVLCSVIVGYGLGIYGDRANE